MKTHGTVGYTAQRRGHSHANINRHTPRYANIGRISPHLMHSTRLNYVITVVNLMRPPLGVVEVDVSAALVVVWVERMSQRAALAVKWPRVSVSAGPKQYEEIRVLASPSLSDRQR